MTHLISTRYDSPVGTLTLVAGDEGLRAVIWPDGRLDRVGLAGESSPAVTRRFSTQRPRQLDEYFAGTRTAFDLPLDLHGTPFQLAAWQALAAIPYGETRTYGEQATGSAGPRPCGRSARQTAATRVSIVLPCHRVIGSNGSLVGFGGGLEVKAALLELERDTPTRAGERRRAVLSPVARSVVEQASPEVSASPARIGRYRGTGEGVLSAASFRT